MPKPGPTPFDDEPRLLKDTARVVAIEGAIAWLQPEPSGGCGACAAASRCGVTTLSGGVGTVARRVQARRFPVLLGDGVPRPEVGERIVVGLPEDALAKAALIAYALPLATMLFAGVAADAVVGSDFAAPLAMAGGLLSGLALARRLARRLAQRGTLVPRLLPATDGALPANPA